MSPDNRDTLADAAFIVGTITLFVILVWLFV